MGRARRTERHGIERVMIGPREEGGGREIGCHLQLVSIGKGILMLVQVAVCGSTRTRGNGVLQ
jgi:hypothetical protein